MDSEMLLMVGILIFWILIVVLVCVNERRSGYEDLVSEIREIREMLNSGASGCVDSPKNVGGPTKVGSPTNFENPTDVGSPTNVEYSTNFGKSTVPGCPYTITKTTKTIETVTSPVEDKSEIKEALECLDGSIENILYVSEVLERLE